MKHAFTEEELGQMRTFMEKVADGTIGARHTDPVVVYMNRGLKKTSKDSLKSFSKKVKKQDVNNKKFTRSKK